MTDSALSKKVIYVAGLPRAGSTLLCQLLGHHPVVYSPGHSSPLSHTLDRLRQQISDEPFLLAQLDVDFDLVYQRLLSAFRGFVNGWFDETKKSWVVDKNRGWLNMVETVNLLDPHFHMLVCVREPTQIYGSIEAQHQRTLLVDFPDDLAGLSRYARADALFKVNGVIGGPLRAIQHVQDLPEAIRSRLYFVVFEHMMEEPLTVMDDLFAWLGLPPHSIDPENLEIRPSESDSYYRFKYPHRTRRRITPPEYHEIPARIAKEIKAQFDWFYASFYPGLGS